MKAFENENRYSLVQQKYDKECGNPVLPYSASSTLPPFLAHDLYGNSGDVLPFKAYFSEAVDESNLETNRLRKVDIFYYLTDDSMQISEPRQENSGVPQGPFLSRRRVPRPSPATDFYTLADLNIGNELEIFGRTFHIVDMGEKTRGVLSSLGMPQGNALPYPTDRYTMDLGKRRSRETGRDPTVPRGKPITALKTYAEATLGRSVAVSQNLGQFLENDRKVLRFYCEWDTQGDLYGGVNRYTVHFFVTDGTVEVREVHTANNGKDPWPMLLSRRRLPKDYHSMVPHRDPVTDPAPKSSFYEVADFVVGRTFNLWGRPMLIKDCDGATREYYRSVLGVQQGKVEDEPSSPPPAKVLPPPAGGLRIGSDSDSLASCLHLRPKKPKVAYHKMMTNTGKVLRYSARLASSRPEDRGRLFVIAYYLADDTLSVYEEKRGNSGIIGGKFLERSRVKHPGYRATADDMDPDVYGHMVGGCPRQYYQPQHLYVGAQLLVLSHTFTVCDMDLFTLNYTMSLPRQFPWADTDDILDRVREHGATAGALRRMRAECPGSELSTASARQALEAAFSEDVLGKQEVVTLCRAFDCTTQVGGGSSKDGATRVRVASLLRALGPSGDSSEAHRPKLVDLSETSATDTMGELSPTHGPDAIRSVLQVLRAAFRDRRHQLTALFQKHDSSASGTLERSEFTRALRDCSITACVQLSGDQHAACVDYFFPGHTRTMRYSTFLDLMDSLH